MLCSGFLNLNVLPKRGPNTNVNTGLYKASAKVWQHSFPGPVNFHQFPQRESYRNPWRWHKIHPMLKMRLCPEIVCIFFNNFLFSLFHTLKSLKKELK